MATGFLKFDKDHTVYIDLNTETDVVNKAVIIDAEDNETPIGGGGGGDFRIIKATLTNITQNILSDIEFLFNNMYYKLPDIGPGETGETWIPVIGDKVYFNNAVFGNITGNAEVDLDSEYSLVATGDFTATVAEGFN